MSRKTVLRHAASRPAIPTFDEWIGAGRSNISKEVEMGSEDEMEEVYPAKRQRRDAHDNVR